MQDTRENEFISKHREYKPPYETEERADGTKIVKIDTRRKLTPKDREMIKALIIAGYKEVHKRKDVSKSDMIKYVKENYDQNEIDLLNKKLESINTTENEKLVTFATIKSWFKSRYIYYPKGLNWNFGKTMSAKEKQERFMKVFNEHKRELAESGKRILAEEIHESQPQNDNNNNSNNNDKHHKH